MPPCLHRQDLQLHGLPRKVVADRDPSSTIFSVALIHNAQTRVKMSTSDHPKTGGQTECANRIVKEIL